MKIEIIPEPITRGISEHMPKILAAVSVAGNALAAYLFIKKTSEFTLETTGKNLAKKDIRKKIVQKFALPTTIFIAANVVTISLGVSSSRDIAGLMAANAYISEGFGEYRAKNIELNGVEKDREIRQAILDDKLKDRLVREFVNDKSVKENLIYACDRVGNGSEGKMFLLNLPEKMLIFSPWHDDFFYMQSNYVLSAFFHANRNFNLHGGYLYLNELFALLGWPELEKCNMLGWDACDGIEYLDFDITYKDVDEDTRIYFIWPLFDPCFEEYD